MPEVTSKLEKEKLEWIAINEKGTRSGSLSLQSRSYSADYALGVFWAFQACLHSRL
jgi:hypothetical protein